MKEQIDSLATIQAVFDELRGNDDHLSTAQLPAAMRLLGMNPTEEDVSQLCKGGCFDSTLDRPAFARLMEEALSKWLAQDQAQELLLSFQAFDTHGNGRMSVEKLAQIMSMAGNPFSAEELEEMLFNAGVDGDGTLAYRDLILRHFLSAESGAARGEWPSWALPGSLAPLQEAATLSEIAKLRAGRGDLEDAVNLRYRALAILEQLHGPQHADVAAALHAIAALKETQGQVEEALDVYGRALAIREKVLGPSHFYVAMTLDSIANLKDRVGQIEEEPSRQQAVMEEALAYACRSLSIWEKVFGPIHPHIAKILYNLAGRKDSLGHVEESLRLYDRALDIHEQLRSEDMELADVLGATANLRERLGEFSAALNLYTRELALREKLFGAMHPEVSELRAIISSLQA
ncbi:Nphp3 [Symbiodinium sp. CCMP2456]|nr:Nphp3 [Symbiodinium sp. CCMP2456]